MLKTKCENCIFENKNLGCIMSKTVFVSSDEKQYTEGFCRHKRNDKWIKKEDYDLADITGRCEKEELGCTTIIIFKDDSIKKLTETISSLRLIDLINREILVVTFNLDKTILLEIMDTLKTSNYAWQLENITDNDIPSNLDVIDYISGIIKNNWFLVLESGDQITEYSGRIITTRFKNNKDNFLCFYYDSKDKSKILTNKYAFAEMRGNSSIPYIEKLMMFNNWEKVCHKISFAQEV